MSRLILSFLFLIAISLESVVLLNRYEVVQAFVMFLACMMITAGLFLFIGSKASD